MRGRDDFLSKRANVAQPQALVRRWTRVGLQKAGKKWPMPLELDARWCASQAGAQACKRVFSSLFTSLVALRFCGFAATGKPCAALSVAALFVERFHRTLERD